MEFFKRFQNRRVIQISLLLGGALLLTIGIFRGEVRVVMMKAIYICLECIGIG